jgi:hypothetical protein
MKYRIALLVMIVFPAFIFSCGDSEKDTTTSSSLSARTLLPGTWQITANQSGPSDCPLGGFDFSGDGIADSTGTFSFEISGVNGSSATVVRDSEIYTAIVTFSGDEFTLSVTDDDGEVMTFTFAGTFISENAVSGTLTIVSITNACTVEFNMSMVRL